MGFLGNKSDRSHRIYHRVKVSIRYYFAYNFRKICSRYTMLIQNLHFKLISTFFFLNSCVFFCPLFCDFLSCLYWESHLSFKRYVNFLYYCLWLSSRSLKPLLIITNDINICINSHRFIKG